MRSPDWRALCCSSHVAFSKIVWTAPQKAAYDVPEPHSSGGDEMRGGEQSGSAICE